MWALILIALAGIADAIRDTISHHKSTSIFKNMAGAFWSEAFGKFLPFTRYKLNIWHLCETLIIMAFTAPIAAWWSWEITKISWMDFLIKWALCGLAYCQPFNLFYNKILRRK